MRSSLVYADTYAVRVKPRLEVVPVMVLMAAPAGTIDPSTILLLLLLQYIIIIIKKKKKIVYEEIERDEREINRYINFETLVHPDIYYYSRFSCFNNNYNIIAMTPFLCAAHGV